VIARMSIFIGGASMNTCDTSALNSSATSGTESVNVGSGGGALGGAGLGADALVAGDCAGGSAYTSSVSLAGDTPSCGGSSLSDGALRMIEVVAVPG
jgi:hypothetical protein